MKILIHKPMKIKYLAITIALASITQVTLAQRGELANAKSNYEKYTELKQFKSAGLGATNLQEAKTSIDKAVVHEKTTSDPLAWTYKALIYADLALLDSVVSKTEPLISEASDALKKASDLDKAGTNKSLIDQAKVLIYRYELNKGVKDYQSSRYDDAFNAFSKALNYKPGDTTLTYYTGLSAINAKNYKAAIQNYEQLTKTSFSSNRQIYLDLSRLYVMQGDTLSGIRVASEGSKKYTTDVPLATQEIELNLMIGKQKEVINKIIDQAQKNPKDKLYPFYLGIAYSANNEPVKAEEAYKNAITIDPNYANAYLNLAGILLNRGIDTYNTANKLPQNKQKEYDEMIKKAYAQFDVALPYLQKAADLDPTSRLALENLKKYYFIKKDKAKEDEINKRLSTLK
jgi:tetratricopeptide (TPR) repeat protein